MGLTFNDTEKKIVTELLNKLHTRHEDYSLEFGFIGDFLSINFIPNKELPIITNSIITDLGIKSLNNAKKFIDFAVIIGDDHKKIAQKIPNIPVFFAKIISKNKPSGNYLAFCGIANPSKFFTSLAKNNTILKEQKRVSILQH